MQIGLIAEGASELCILKHILGRYLGTEHDLNEIQPRTDATGTQIVPGGWDRVIKTFEYENTVKEALLENNYVLIQIDTDYAQTAPFSVNILDDNGQCCPPEVIHQRVKDRILSHIPGLTDEARSRILLAICINEIECWLLPIFYNDNKRCHINRCVDLLNHRLRMEKIDSIVEKNNAKARNTYDTILRKLKKAKDIEACSQYNFGFHFLIEQLKVVKQQSVGNEA